MRFFIRHKLPDACLSLRDLVENSTRVLRFELRIWRLKLPILPLNYTLSELLPLIPLFRPFYSNPSPSLHTFFYPRLRPPNPQGRRPAGGRPSTGLAVPSPVIFFLLNNKKKIRKVKKRVERGTGS